MAADKQAEVEAQFEKLHSLTTSGKHQQVLKAVEASKCVMQMPPAAAQPLLLALSA